MQFVKKIQCLGQFYAIYGSVWPRLGNTNLTPVLYATVQGNPHAYDGCINGIQNDQIVNFLPEDLLECQVSCAGTHHTLVPVLTMRFIFQQRRYFIKNLTGLS